MDDTLDVLKVSREDAPPAKKRPRAKPKRPEGISREAFSLLDGSHPVVQTTTPFKKRFVRKEIVNKKRKGDVGYTVSYKWKPFRNEARTDKLELKKWVRCFTDRQGNFREAITTEYPFAKLNKAPDVLRYSELEWDRCLSGLSIDWTDEETKYLLEMCRMFSLRFAIIHDRYTFQGKSRSYEELKERYYAMAHALACFRSGEELPSKYLQKHPYDAAYEQRRREACRAVMEMTMEEEWRDDAILEEAERIETRRLEGATITPSISSDDAESEVSLSRVLGGHDQMDTLPLHDSKGCPWRPEPGIYVRGLQTKRMMPDASRAPEEKVLKDFSVDGTFPTVCSKKLIKAWIDLRNDAAVLARLRELTESEGPKNVDSAI